MKYTRKDIEVTANGLRTLDGMYRAKKHKDHYMYWYDRSGNMLGRLDHDCVFCVNKVSMISAIEKLNSLIRIYVSIIDDSYPVTTIDPVRQPKLTRKMKLSSLLAHYNQVRDEDPRQWPEKFLPHGYLTESNHGGLLIIISNDGEGVLLWRDWGGEAVDVELTRGTIEHVPYAIDKDAEGGELQAVVQYDKEMILLNEFISIRS